MGTPLKVDRLLPTAVVLDRLGISKTQLYRLIKAGDFPKSLTVGKKRRGYLESELAAWFDKRIAMRDAGVGDEERRQSAMRAVGGRK